MTDVKNIIIAVLILALVGETSYVIVKIFGLQPSTQSTTATAIPARSETDQPRPASPSGRLPLLTKGDNLLTSALFQYAYQLAPGDTPAATQKVLTGFTVDKQASADGSVVVKLIPKESDDQYQEYTVLPGQTLYFIEQTPADDQPDTDKDKNLRDDYGIIVDGQGIIQ